MAAEAVEKSVARASVPGLRARDQETMSSTNVAGRDARPTSLIFFNSLGFQPPGRRDDLKVLTLALKTANIHKRKPVPPVT